MYSKNTETYIEDPLTLMNRAVQQQYKLSLQSSSNMTSNVLLKEAWQRNNELFNETTIKDISDSAIDIAQNADTSHINTWRSCLNKPANPVALFEKSYPQCPTCSNNEQNIDFRKFTTNNCKCDLGFTDTVSDNFIKNSFENQNSTESKTFKPKIGRSKLQKQSSLLKCINSKDYEIDKSKQLNVSEDVNSEDENKAHKSLVAKITFKTAKEQLLASNPAAKRTLGASRKAQGKFVSPMLGSQEKQETSEPVVTDDRLKHIDPKMIELIESEIIDKGTPIGWEDIAGLQMAKSVIQEAVVWPLLRPDIFTGLRRPPKGILLFGPPGTGKTLIGKCVASQCRATFFSISASSLTSKWIGDGEKMVRALFAVARCHQPAVIFIDEIDSLLTQRSDTEHEATRRIKTEFLVQFDGASTDEAERVLVVGATNRPHELDEAARRRLGKRLYIPLPDRLARTQIINNLLKNEQNDLSAGDVEAVAGLTEGYSGADMKAVCAEAAMGPIRAVPLSQMVSIDRNQVRPVSAEDFRAALQRVRPSVSQADLGQYVRWNDTYGQGS